MMRPAMLFAELLLLLLELATCNATDCHDKSASCSLSTCSKFPEFSRNNCAKTCGLCGSSSIEGHGSHRSSISSSHQSMHSRTSSSSVLCMDKDLDCSQEICRNYPYTAKERCAKTCGMCGSTASGIPSSSSHHSGSLSFALGESSITCVDVDTECGQDTCINYPHTAKHRCAKTCGLCDSSSSSTHQHSRTDSLVSSSDGIHSSAPASPSRSSSGSVTGILCKDNDSDCTQQTCRDYPYTAKERCAKTCNLCNGDVTSSSGSTSASHSRHSSISSHHSTDSDRSHPSDSILTRDKDIECMDLDVDCKPATCRDYPYTAKQRCAKTCGFCQRGDQRSTEGHFSRHSSIGGGTSSSSDSTRISSQATDIHHSTATSSRRTSTSSDRRASTASGHQHGAGSLTGDASSCVDKDGNCDDKICKDLPHTARDKCAKTCGFCDDGDDALGSRLSLSGGSIDHGDGQGTLITLDGDGDSRRQASTGYRPENGVRSGSLHQSSASSRHGSITSDSFHHYSSTQAPPPRAHQRTRTGPCTDENMHCDKGDCFKYPRFSQRYCEKTCGFC